MTEKDGEPDRVSLTLPAHVRHVATARVVAASLAAGVGFDVDAIDDLRLAIAEAAGVLLDADTATDSAPERLTAEFRVSPGRVVVGMSVLSADGGVVVPVEIDELALRILAAVVDRFEMTGGVLTLEVTTARSAAV